MAKKQLSILSLVIILTLAIMVLLLPACSSSPSPAPPPATSQTAAPAASSAPAATSKPATSQPAGSSAPAATSSQPAASQTATSQPATSKPAPSSSTASASEIVLGATAPLTGDLAGFGQGSGWALQAAVDDLNKQGGIMVKELGRKLPVRLVLLDNQSSPIKAGTLAESLILQDKVNFLVSGNESPPAFASTATQADKYKIPYVGNIGPFEPYQALASQATPPWSYIWGTGFHIGAPAEKGDFREGKPGYTIVDVSASVINQFANDTNKKTAIFASDEPDGRGWYAAFPAGLTKMGLIVDGADKELGLAPPNTTDFSTIINTWKKNNDEIMFGNALAPWFGTLWKQSRELNYRPKLVYAGRAALYYTDISSWGGDLPNGICCEQLWSPKMDPKVCKGIGDTTPQSLADRWTVAKNQPLNQAIGWSYANVQSIAAAIEAAGSLDKAKVNAAMATIDIQAIGGRLKYDSTHFSQWPMSFGQWQKTDKPSKWEWQTIVSAFDFIPVTAKPLFPIP
jgi:branched-chain amino acid transport system substrate-binding protein